MEETYESDQVCQSSDRECALGLADLARQRILGSDVIVEEDDGEID